MMMRVFAFMVATMFLHVGTSAAEDGLASLETCELPQDPRSLHELGDLFKGSKFGWNLEGVKEYSQTDYAWTYADVLEPYRTKKFSLLELGLGPWPHCGASLQAWRVYFPCATLHGVDNDPESVAATRALGIPNAHLYLGDLGNTQFVHDLAVQLFVDVVIDDASHCIDHQLLAYDELFLWSLKPGGLYAVEDIEFSYWSDRAIADRGCAPAGPLSTVEAFKGHIDRAVNSKFTYRPEVPPTVLDTWLASISFSQNLIILKKKGQRDCFKEGHYVWPYRLREGPPVRPEDDNGVVATVGDIPVFRHWCGCSYDDVVQAHNRLHLSVHLDGREHQFQFHNASGHHEDMQFRVVDFLRGASPALLSNPTAAGSGCALGDTGCVHVVGSITGAALARVRAYSSARATSCAALNHAPSDDFASSDWQRSRRAEVEALVKANGLQYGSGCTTSSCIVDKILLFEQVTHQPRRDAHMQRSLEQVLHGSHADAVGSHGQLNAALRFLSSETKGWLEDLNSTTVQSLPTIDCVDGDTAWGPAYVDGELFRKEGGPALWEACTQSLVGAVVVNDSDGYAPQSQEEATGNAGINASFFSTLPTGALDAWLQQRCPTYDASRRELIRQCTATDTRRGYAYRLGFLEARGEALAEGRNALAMPLGEVHHQHHQQHQQHQHHASSAMSLLVSSAFVSWAGDLHTPRWRLRLPGCHHTPHTFPELWDAWNHKTYWDRRFNEFLQEAKTMIPHVSEDALVVSVATRISHNFGHQIIDSLLRVAAVADLFVVDDAPQNSSELLASSSTLIHLGGSGEGGGVKVRAAAIQLLRFLLAGAVAARHPSAMKTHVQSAVDTYLEHNVVGPGGIFAGRVLIARPAPCLIFDADAARKFRDLVSRGRALLDISDAATLGEEGANEASRPAIVLVSRQGFSRQLPNFQQLSVALRSLAEEWGLDFLNSVSDIEPPANAMRTMARAALLVGTHSSALVNMFLAPTHHTVAVIELWGDRRHAACETCMSRIADALQLPYTALPLQSPNFTTANVSTVIAAAEFFLSQAGAGAL